MAVEFALIAPILILLVMGIIDFGYMINRDTMINNVSRDAARVASLDGTYAQILSTVQGELSGYGINTTGPGTTITISCVKADGTACGAGAAGYDHDATSGATTTVKIQYQYSWMTPTMSSLLGSTISLSKQTEMRVE
ncbi:MAG: TadE/TadG family type IV pilus assembly protein [Mycobacteriaceae bacterium]